jgi:hypothetical protein
VYFISAFAILSTVLELNNEARGVDFASITIWAG